MFTAQTRLMSHTWARDRTDRKTKREQGRKGQLWERCDGLSSTGRHAPNIGTQGKWARCSVVGFQSWLAAAVQQNTCTLQPSACGVLLDSHRETPQVPAV